MDKGWFIGMERILPSKSDPPPAGSFSTTGRPSLTVNLTKMLQASSSNAEKKPVPIRPPSPKVSAPKAPEFRRSLSCEPPPKPIIRYRSYSLPPPKQKKHCKHVGVRFVDSLGLNLEDIKLFKAGDEPLIPHHVTFKLLMAAEMADGRHLEISLPYLKPIFNQHPGDRPEFLHCLHTQKVCLERVFCFELGIIGITQVLNLDFAKDVRVRYSFTDWKSFAETKASWVSTITKTWEGGGGEFSCDTFRFHLPVPPFLQPGAVLEFAIQYRVSGMEYWDNNFGENYKLVCHNYKLAVPKECQDSMVHFV
ncbi:protein phosphatase 1, regulatory subunit 3Da [Synchiropus splendidus]|uniref:protein phosphatase 1, regulatory subunit 3Da n=1 Tax=Synchiropus splendidus TaxID=270530 RepID=UPI00237E131D|nr:protein phosphatase 1, regulatory subunit 3Da [Synchiropus splendidus]XP_053705918.1 protein phosphatase 1, regulatory subunit 3Da [Synchiropus splendidus]